MRVFLVFIVVLFVGILDTKAQVQGAKSNIIDEFDALIAAKKWHEAKQKADQFLFNYPEHPTTIDSLENEAVKLYNELINRTIYQEEQLFSEIKNTENENKCREYLSRFPYGKHTAEVRAILENNRELEDWEHAKDLNTIDAYNEYLDEYPNGDYRDEALAAKDKLDQDAYSYAKSQNTIYAFENYLSRFKNGRYTSEARQEIEKLKEDNIYNTAKNNNGIDDYEYYISLYPDGKYATTVHNILKTSYIFYADDYFDNKDFSRAKVYYQKYVTNYPYDVKASYARNAIEKCDRKMRAKNRPDRWYFSYHFDDSLGFFGFSGGTINQKSLGYYVSGRMNFNNPLVLYDFYPSTLYVDGIWDNDDITLNGEYQVGKLFASTGFTYGLFNPIWIYGGVGFSLTNHYVGIDKWYSDGSLYESDWAKVKEIDVFWPHAEAGVQMDLWGLNLRYGISYSSMYGLRNTFGIGISGIRY